MSGRSPFAARRRDALEEPSPRTSNASSFMLGQSLIQARLSLSPAARSTSGPPRRFFPTTSNTAAKTSGSNDAGMPMSATGAAQPGDAAPALEMTDGLPLDHLQSLVESATLQHRGKTAIFYAAILYTKRRTPEVAMLYARALLGVPQPRRAIRLLEDPWMRKSSDTSALWRLEATLVMAQAYQQLEDLNGVQQVLEDVLTMSPVSLPLLAEDDDFAWQAWKDQLGILLSSSQTAPGVHPLAQYCCLRGWYFRQTQQPDRAILYWKRALSIDVQCVEAWDSLWTLSPDSESLRRFLESSACSFQSPHHMWLKRLYMARVEESGSSSKSSSVFIQQNNTNEENNGTDVKSSTRSNLQHLQKTHGLAEAPQVLCIQAQQAYQRMDWQGCFDACQRLQGIQDDPSSIGHVYICACIALQKKRHLFQLAHDWVEAQPQDSLSWFAVGGYYYAISNFTVAQRYFSRATRLDPHSVASWIALGCSFARVDESDPALASFRAAQRVGGGSGSHSTIPWAAIYMGMEYLRTNHLSLAKHFLSGKDGNYEKDLEQNQHFDADRHHPLVWNERGVLAYKQSNYPLAIHCFRKSLDSSYNNEDDAASLRELLSSRSRPNIDEAIVFNLGQAYRKEKQFESAALCFEHAWESDPSSSQAATALGLVQLCMFHIDDAIHTLHQSLSVHAEDSIAQELLHLALQHQAQQAVIWLPPASDENEDAGKTSFAGSDPAQSLSLESDGDIDMSM